MFRFGQSSGESNGSPSPARGADIHTCTLRAFSLDPLHRRPRLLDRHLLLLVTVGHGSQEVDFRGYPCRPGTLIWAQPGQVVQHGEPGGLDAILVSWAPEAVRDLGLAPVAAPSAGTGYWQLAGEDEDAVINEVSQLVVDCQRHRTGDVAVDLLRHQLAVLLLRLALLSPGPGALGTSGPGGHQDRTAADENGGTYRRLRYEIERSYGQTRRVEHYAERLGCSVRTLTRACLAATGRSAKQIVDDRVTFEAMRLLAATDLPVAEIGRRLGFTEPTNFGRFFQREVGQSPGAFRLRHRGPARPPTVPIGESAV